MLTENQVVLDYSAIQSKSVSLIWTNFKSATFMLRSKALDSNISISLLKVSPLFKYPATLRECKLHRHYLICTDNAPFKELYSKSVTRSVRELRGN